MRRHPVALLLLGLAGAACAATHLPEVDPELVLAGAAHGFTAADLERGRSLMLGSCIACHGVVHPRALTTAEWREVLPRMIHHAKLTAGDRDAIDAFVVTVGTASGEASGAGR